MLLLVQTELKDANAFIAAHHRHHKPVVGHRFSIGCAVRTKGVATDQGGDTDGLKRVGVAIVGRPVARGCDPRRIIEVTRLCTDGTKNACSFLYSAAARIARDLGYEKIQTYLLDSEEGASLRASGWELEGVTRGGEWKHSAGPRRKDQPTCPKQRWVKRLND